MNKKKIIIIILVVGFLVAAMIIPQFMGQEKTKVSKSDFCLDTVCFIDLYDIGAKEGEELASQAFKKCHEYEDMLSRTVEGSDIYKINHARGKKVEVSKDTAKLITTSLELSEGTQGMFDISIGRLSALWDFSSENPRVPASSDIKKLLPSVGYEKVHIDGQKVWIDDPETWLDLGAIAKGYIADKISDYLVQEGVKHGIVNLGGNIVCIGEKPGQGPWKVGIESPGSERKEIVDSVEMKDMTLVTSGTYERFIEENGKKYHHVLNPHTGWPVDTDLQSVSILGQRGQSMYCDAFSTVCLLKGEKGALDFMKSHPEFGILTVKNDSVSSCQGKWPGK